MKRVIDVDAELNKLESKIGNMSIQPATLFDIHFIKDCLISNNSISEALVELRKYLCTCNSSAIDMVLHLGILETLWNLTKSLVDKDVYEICWILTNLSAGNEQQTEILVNNGIIELMSQLLTSTSDEVVVQAAWCLGNISGDQKDYRERIMVNLSSYNGLSFFMSRKSMQSEFPLKVFAWVLSNLCRLQPSNEYWGFIVIDLQVCIYNLDIFNCNDEQTIIDFCWALTRCLHSVESLHRKQLVNAALVDGIFGVVSRFNRPNVLIPVFRVLTNIVAGDDQETFHVVANDKIEVIVGFLNVKNNPLLKECLMCLSNIAASNTHGSKLHHSTILLQILSMLQSENTDVVKLECLWILSNCSSMNEVLLQYLLFI